MIMSLPLHPLSMAATSKPKADPLPPVRTPAKPMSGSRRKAVYRRQGGQDMTAAQRARYDHKVARNGYIPKTPSA